jgi:hypothetical protein
MNLVAIEDNAFEGVAPYSIIPSLGLFERLKERRR